MASAISSECSGLCVTAANDKLLVEDIIIPKQECGIATTKMLLEEDMSRIMEKYSDPTNGFGYPPERYWRIWVH